VSVSVSRATWPENWIRSRLKHVCDLKAGGTPQVDRAEYWAGEDEGIPWVSIADMTRDPCIRETARRVSYEGARVAGLAVGAPGTLLFSMYASLGSTARLAVPATWNQAILGITPRGHGVNGRFLEYALTAAHRDLKALARSNTQDNLNAEQVGNLTIDLPPARWQINIVDYLDTETRRIDGLITKKRALRDLLIERRLAVLQAAVDGRLTVAGPRREHPLHWLDSLPVDWPTIKLSFVARLGSGHTPSRTHPEYWTDCTIPWITTGEVAQVRDDRREVITQTRERISELGLANSAAEVHPAGTVVLCRTASAGYSAIMGSDMATSQDFATWTCSPRLLPRFLLACLRAMRPDLLGRLSMGSTHKTIYMPDIQALHIPLPPVAEQQSALDAADRELKTIDALLDSLDTQIRLLHERRQALITEVVTGQRRVDAHPLVAA